MLTISNGQPIPSQNGAEIGSGNGPESDHESDPLFSPFIPSSSATPPRRPSSKPLVLLADEQAIRAILETLLERAGLTRVAAAKMLGVRRQTLEEIINGRRKLRASVSFITKLAWICGHRLVLEPIEVKS